MLSYQTFATWSPADAVSTNTLFNILVAVIWQINDLTLVGKFRKVRLILTWKSVRGVHHRVIHKASFNSDRVGGTDLTCRHGCVVHGVYRDCSVHAVCGTQTLAWDTWKHIWQFLTRLHITLFIWVIVKDYTLHLSQRVTLAILILNITSNSASFTWVWLGSNQGHR